MSQELPENIIAEYNALREEMLLRLRVQQDVINYSLLFVGFVATILTIQNFDIGAVSIVLLFGPLIGIFLAFVYLKQHLFIQALSGYISELRLPSISDKDLSGQASRPFGGWDNFLTETFYVHRLPTIFTGVIGLAEGLFPLLIGTVCLLLFSVFSISNSLLKSSLPPNLATKFGLDAITLLNIWAIVDGVLLAASIIFNQAVRKWAVKQRRSWISTRVNPAAATKSSSSPVARSKLKRESRRKKGDD